MSLFKQIRRARAIRELERLDRMMCRATEDLFASLEIKRLVDLDKMPPDFQRIYRRKRTLRDIAGNTEPAQA